MPQRRRDTKQFKEEALRLVSQEGVSLTPVAQQPGASPSSAHNREIIVPPEASRKPLHLLSRPEGPETTFNLLFPIAILRGNHLGSPL
ncbi:MAG: hypothetical protein ACE1ZW_05305 [Nitrospirales bacterium]